MHFVRDMLYHCRRDQRGLVAAALREVFNADDQDQARERITHVIARLEPIAPKVCRLLEDAEEDLIAFYLFPGEHWTKLRSTDESVKARGSISWVCASCCPCLWRRLVAARGSLAGTDVGETRFGWGLQRAVGAGGLVVGVRNRRRVATSLPLGCQRELRFRVGVVDPGAKRRFWD